MLCAPSMSSSLLSLSVPLVLGLLFSTTPFTQPVQLQACRTSDVPRLQYKILSRVMGGGGKFVSPLRQQRIFDLHKSSALSPSRVQTSWQPLSRITAALNHSVATVNMFLACCHTDNTHTHLKSKVNTQ